MYGGQNIAVVIPAFNEERLICLTLSGVPGYVDTIIVVDDASNDRTAEVVLARDDARICLLRHSTNRGVGAAIVTGYREALTRAACCRGHGW